MRMEELKLSKWPNITGMRERVSSTIKSYRKTKSMFLPKKKKLSKYHRLKND